MTSDIQLFNYGENPVRTVIKDGQVWFVAKDVCDILELGNITEALRNLDNDELSSVPLKSGGQNRDMRVVSESGMYALVFKSKKPEAKKFRKWVTSEVLPSIRNTGKYEIEKQEDTEAAAQEKEIKEQEKFNYISRGIMSSAKKIYDLALACKTTEDFQAVIALDKVFQEFTGKSALEIGTFRLVERTEKTRETVYFPDSGYWYKENYYFEWEHNLPVPSEFRPFY